MSEMVKRIGCLAAAVTVLVGCSGVREHVRQYDFRSMRRAASREKAVASPVADVLDMSGWTSDFDGATAFARVNGQRTVVLFYGSGTSSAKAKQAAESVARRATNLQKVALDIQKKKGIAARLGVEKAPAIVVLDPSGRVVAKEEGNLSKDRLGELIGL
ncbi:MAG: TlpA family protein disulfide reductase [Candidatus Sumerlaeaceae bacterium]